MNCRTEGEGTIFPGRMVDLAENHDKDKFRLYSLILSLICII
jgi:hypothetical protein